MATPSAQSVRERVYHAPYDRPDIGADFRTLNYAHDFAARFGQPQQLYDLYLLLNRKETTSVSTTNARVDAVAARPLEVIAGGDGDDDVAVADSFSAIWAEIDHSFVSHLAFSMNVFGLAGAEIDWSFDADRDMFVPDGIFAVRSRSLGWTVPQNWGYFDGRAIDGRVGSQTPPNTYLIRVGLFEWETLTEDKWIVVTPNAPASPADRGLSWSCSFLAILILAGYAGWTAFVDRYGLPMLHVVIADWTDTRAANTARQIIRSWGSDKGILTARNDGLNFNIVDGAQSSRVSSSDVHQRYVQDARAQISKVWTAGTLTQDTAQNGGSPRALGEVHSSGFLRAVEADLKLLIRSLENQLIRPWMRFNNLRARPPKFRAQTATVESPIAAASLAQLLGTAGYDVDTNELSKVVGVTVTRREHS